MSVLKRLFSLFFFFLMVLAFWQCARRGNPSGGPKDVTPAVLLRTSPDNLTTNFEGNTIRLYFDEYIKLKDVQNQLIVSPPLKYIPDIKPLGGASKFIEITIKDTLSENTTYTINFGQSIVDNNEGNPTSFLTYVFSTGDYIDSLNLKGAVKDAYNRKADEFISVMLYEIDTAYTDSTIYKKPPNYITNTLDSLPLFELKNLKAGSYALFGVKDEGKNNLFDQRADKIGFLQDTVTLPTDTVYLLNLFKEKPLYSAAVPSYVADNKIIFGYQGAKSIKVDPLTLLPDSVRTTTTKERDKDTLNFWFTPTALDSIIFMVTNTERNVRDTFTVKTRKLASDSLQVSPTHQRRFDFEEQFKLQVNTPIVALDTSKINLIHNDSLELPVSVTLDTLQNQLDFDFEVYEGASYAITALPGAITDFFGQQNDTLNYELTTGKYADFGNLQVNIEGVTDFPILVHLTNDKGETQRSIYAEEPQVFEFNHLNPTRYGIRIIFDTNKNGEWDTGNYLKKIQPERISYYPGMINVRANWELVETFTVAPE